MQRRKQKQKVTDRSALCHHFNARAEQFGARLEHHGGRSCALALLSARHLLEMSTHTGCSDFLGIKSHC